MNVRTAIVAFFTACGLALIAQDDPQVPLRDGEREVASGNYTAAAVHMRAALNIVVGVVSEPALMRSVILRTAEVESLAGNFDEADKLVRTLQQFEGASTEDTVRAQTVLARSESARGNQRAATTAASDAVNLALAHSDLNIDWRLNALAELAEIRRLDGNFAEARRLTATFGSANMASPRLSATALAAPAQIAWSDGHVVDARRLAEAALAIRTRARPADHPDLLMLRELLARVALGEGRLQDAAQSLNGLSEAARPRLGASHPFTIDSQLTEASYYARRAAYNESESRLDRATSAAARLPANSRVRLRLTEMRAIVALGLHRSTDAASAAAQAAQFAAKDRADAPQMATVLNVQAAAAIDQRRFSDAQTLLQNADSILASRAAETETDRMDTLMYSGLLAAGAGDTRKAVDTLGKWVNLRGTQANDEPEAVVLRTLARSAMLQKDYAQAANSFTRALAIRSDIGGLPDRELSSDYLDLGTALKSSNKLPEAVTAFRRALDLRERPGESRPESLPVYTALADTLLAERKPSEALPYLETRLRLIDPSGRARSDDTLRLADQVSRLEFSEGRYQNAEPLLRRLYDAALAGQGPAAQDRAELLARLGDVETKLSRNSEAVRFLEELSRIDLLRKKLPEASDAAERAAEAGKKSTSPISIASSLNALADIRVAQGKLDDAAALYEQARSTEGADSRARAISLNGLGRIALNKKQWNDADTLLNQALEAVRLDSNPSPGLEALVVANLAASQLAADHADRATELYARFLALEPLSHPPEDPPLLEQLDELARFYSVRNRTQDVLDVYNRGLRSSQLVFGDQSDEFARALFQEAEFYRNQKQYKEATPLYERSAQLYRALYGDRSDQVQNVTISLVDAYRAEARPQDAIQLLEPLVNTGTSGDASLLQGDLLDRLAGLYRQTSNQAEAIRIYENLVNNYAAQAPAFQNSKWLEATKNLIAANVEAKKVKEATALYDKAVLRIHTSARKDTPSEVSLMRAYSAVLRKENRAKEADSIENKAKRIEQSLGGR